MSEPSFTPASANPVLTTPPPLAPPPVQCKKRSVLVRLLAIFVLLVLGVSVLGNIVLLVTVAGLGSLSGLGDGSANVTEETLVSGGRKRIAVLPIEGAIDESMVERVRVFADAIQHDMSIKAVVLAVDSPGGGVTASDEIYHTLKELKQKRQIPIWVSMGSLAASGGYYVSMAADKIYAEPTTITGSIGVIWPAFECSNLLEKIGVTPEIITSSEAKFKDAASPFKKFTPEDVAYIRSLVNDAHGKFRKIVENGRAGKLKKDISEIAIGKVWPADVARDEFGLVDEIAYLDQVYSKLAAEEGLTNPTVVRLKERHSILEALGAASTMHGGKLQIDPKMIYELQNPKMEYRYIPPTFGMKE